MKATLTYLFYDIESSGLNKCFDQVMQFAAIRTDLELNELERYDFLVKLNPDVIPAPMAILTHRIGLKEAAEGICEYDAIKKIHDLLNAPGTISLGYNTLGFDDEFLRFSFFRNLLPPYTHQYANQCGRMDLYPMTVMYYLFKKDALQWPILKGKISMKLENLSKENALADGQAHNAMVDVEATLALAHKFKAHPDMWKYVTDYFNKKTDVKRCEQLVAAFTQNDTPFLEGLIVSPKLGTRSNFMAPVINIGQHEHYKNQSLWLRLDTEQLQSTTADTIAENTYVLRKRAGESPFVLPPLPRFIDKLDSDRLSLASQNKQWLQDNPDIVQLICDYYQHFKYPEVPNCDADAALYTLDFPSSREDFLFRQFHSAASTDEKLKFANQFPTPTRHTNAIRIIGRQDVKLLSEEEQLNFQAYLNTILKDNNPPVNFQGVHRLTPSKAKDEITEIRKDLTLDEQQTALLIELEEYLAQLTTLSE